MIKQTLHGTDGNVYGIEIGVSELGFADDGPYCLIRLLPYEGLLFCASLEMLDMTGVLEDGDATFVVPREVIDAMILEAVQNDYKWEPLV